MDYDCIVIGAGPAGLSAALMLGRARRKTLVLDHGQPRNHAARHMHGVLGHDGLDPAELRAKGRGELARYDIEVRNVEVDRARAIDGGIAIDDLTARTVIIATGMLDDTPPFPGFDAIYGISAHTCPYCDGFEHADKRLAAYAPGFETHIGTLLRQWSGDVMLFTNGAELEDTSALDAAGTQVNTSAIVRFDHLDGRLTAVVTESGESIARDALFFAIQGRPRTRIAEQLGAELDAMGYIKVSPVENQTTVDRVYAAGNCTSPMFNVPMSIAEGVRAGAMINHRLVAEGVVQPRRLVAA